MLTIEKTGTAEQTIQKSRFYALAGHCQTEREVGLFLRQLAAQHQNAHHLAYAFRIKTADGIIPRFSDAGEPSGTAGKPVLQMLEGRDLINVAVGVIRYYGGINLGTGGLARAYGGTAKMALDTAQITNFVEMQEFSLSVQYNRIDELTRLVSQLKGKVLDKHFDQAVHVRISLPVAEVNAFVGRFN
ncbi:IMPACT family protein [Methylotenera versatilis]|uniref:IMPACT family protein n=1 Tax=Methylotenera versatilis TaxID=1055487 RepID=UPI0006474926|nr:YigZ family protein [Methylotenera versatilis]